MHRKRLHWIWLFLIALTTVPGAPAADRYLAVRIADLKIVEGALADLAPSPSADEQEPVRFRRRWMIERLTLPYVIMDGAGEAFPEMFDAETLQWGAFRPTAESVTANSTLLIRLPEGAPATGRLYLVKPDASGMIPLRFEIPADLASAPDAQSRYLVARQGSYQYLQNLGLPGRRWFGEQERRAAAAQAAATSPTATDLTPTDLELDPTMAARDGGRPRADDLEDTFSLFSGGQAIAENLQLDRLLRIEGQPTEEPTVDVDSIAGITLQEIDWKPLLAATPPALDPLAGSVPADQHALFFPTFDALVRLIDEADKDGTTIMRMLDFPSQDAGTRERYQRQLCLPLDQFARLFGPALVASVALTGSDAYLATGSDAAVLFQARDAQALAAALTARQAQALAEHSGAGKIQGEIAGVAWQGVRTPDRAVCAYLATVGDTVAVSNSLSQLEKVVKASKGDAPALASLDEYRFFRQRYAIGEDDETALFVVSDAAIRRWCGPRWRIGASRRIRAAAMLSELQIRRLDALMRGMSDADAAKAALDAGVIDGIGDIAWDHGRAVSSVYGGLDFQTPIAELPLDRATPAEAAAYDRFRGQYQMRWRGFFDPIALRFSVGDDRLAADLTVMPLILGSEYRQFMAIANGAAFEPTDGDPDIDAMAHFIMALNLRAPQIAMGVGMLDPSRNLENNLVAWMGSWVSLHADHDPVWNELLQDERRGRGNDELFYRLPLVLQFPVRDPLRLTLFLTGLRGMIDQNAPGMSVWNRLDHDGRPYVRVSAADGSSSGSETMALYYAATPTRLIVSLREDTLKKTMDHHSATSATTAATRPPAEAAGEPARASAAGGWLGRQLALQVDRNAFHALRALGGETYADRVRQQSWNNLPILNEWRRRLGEQDPVAFHERLWGRRLVDPSGGEYVWNETWQTMESTVAGHPGQPKNDISLPPTIQNLRQGDFGLTFENDGLRARGVLARDGAEALRE
jgi:hypothetical protein